ncbi:hypothetical protein V9T40_011806 [Parthenolecanium corni]|uniref:Uncharacterized protein n=1 Tax=Parthenolecanium corni TaxID=536013 RepID=A0AAN9XZV2_9HEMI
MLTLEKPGLTRLREGPDGVIYDATRITSKDQVASSDTNQNEQTGAHGCQNGVQPRHHGEVDGPASAKTL